MSIRPQPATHGAPGRAPVPPSPRSSPPRHQRGQRALWAPIRTSFAGKVQKRASGVSYLAMLLGATRNSRVGSAGRAPGRPRQPIGRYLGWLSWILDSHALALQIGHHVPMSEPPNATVSSLHYNPRRTTDQPPGDWSESEKAMWVAFLTGGELDLRDADPIQNDPATASDWGRARSLRASVIAQIILDPPRLSLATPNA